MGYKESIIALLNKVYRNCTFTDVLLTPVGTMISSLYGYIETLKNNFFFDTLDEDGCSYFEALLGITDVSDDLETRRAVIQARWLSSNHNSLTLIQNVCDAWSDSSITADFLEGKIVIYFYELLSTENLNKLIEAINLIKPAHLPLKFVYALTGAGTVSIGAGLVEHIKTAFTITE